MNHQQMNAAMKALVDWLKDPRELGKAPAKIECAGTFTLREMTYYIFKYKKNILSKWLLGVSGGFEENSLELCGHMFSEMQEYREASAKEDAIKLVETVRSYWIKQAEDAERNKENPGTFVNFVLLKDAKWNKEAFIKCLTDEWQITCEEKEDNEKDEYSNICVMLHDGYTIAVSMIDSPITSGEVEVYAQRNFRWKDAVTISKSHKAHLVVAIMGKNKDPKKAGELLVKSVTACCKSADVLGIYGSEIVFQPEFYLEFTELMKQGMFPLFNLVWFGIYKSDNGFSGYTSGLAALGKDEIEVIDSKADPTEIGEFLSDIANYVLEYDVTLRDGETIGFSAEQKLPITKSEGVMVQGMSLKIGY